MLIISKYVSPSQTSPVLQSPNTHLISQLCCPTVISNLTCPKANFWFSCKGLLSHNLPYLCFWQLHPISCSGQNPQSHPWLLSFSYTPHPIHHEIMLALPSYCNHYPPPLLPPGLRNIIFHLYYFDRLLKDLPASTTGPTQSTLHPGARVIHAKHESHFESSVQNPVVVSHFTTNKSQTSYNIM